MTKREVIWLTIRLLGLYTLYLTVRLAIGESWWRLLAGETFEWNRVTDLTLLVVPAFWFGLYALLSYYLLRRGDWLFRLLNREGGEGDVGDVEDEPAARQPVTKTDDDINTTWPPSIR